MRKFWPVLLVFVAGCYCAAPAPSVPVAPPVQPAPQPPMPPMHVPAIPSAAFMKGYRDGYNGTWLAPGRWMVVDDYRQGWSLGRHDAQNGIERYKAVP